MNELERKLSPGLRRSMGVGILDVRRAVVHAACFRCKDGLERRRIRILHELPLIGAYVVELPMRAVPVLASMGYVKYIEDDIAVRINLDAAGETIAVESVRAMGLDGRGVTIACIDTGIHPHRDFLSPENRIVRFVDFVDGRDEPYDDNGHGTFCMSCAGGSGAASEGRYRGVAPASGLIMLKALDADGGGAMVDILRAMQWVADNKAKYNIRVLSMSLGVEPGLVAPGHDTLSDMAEALWRHGIVVVTAAGNSGPREGTINSPGSADSVITVGAVDDREGELRPARFSSRGKRGQGKPDVLAPGVKIRAAANSASGYTVMSGTSMAAPIVAGCAALLIQQRPELTPDAVKRAVKESAVSIGISEQIQGSGVINCAALAGV